MKYALKYSNNNKINNNIGDDDDEKYEKYHIDKEIYLYNECIYDLNRNE